MRIVVDIGHPAHVHFFKNFIREMEKRGHEIKIIARNKDITVNLLKAYNFPFFLLDVKPSSFLLKILNMPVLDFKVLKQVKKFNPDLFVGIASWRAAQVAFLLRKKSIIFDDTEHASKQNLAYRLFASIICTPTCFQKDYGEKQIRYKGYHELAYLHPNNFTSDSAILDEVGLTQEDPFFIIRFVSWGAIHDVGQCGISDKISFVKKIAQYGRVIITSEKPLPPELDPYVLKVAPEKLHDLLFYATLTISEGATTASESVVLGTHAIYINSLRAGSLDEQESKYNLLYIFSDKTTMNDSALNKIIKLINEPNIRAKGKKKREILLNDKIDVTGFMISLAEKTIRHKQRDLR